MDLLICTLVIENGICWAEENVQGVLVEDILIRTLVISKMVLVGPENNVKLMEKVG